ncbi:tRNA pseudouridine(55) synthase TruB [Candidatus Saccharibacteria bacterium]|nr:tRNA pseudouridine(55) synthase TruB [Candidatus Saccharibacteria bacterium]
MITDRQSMLLVDKPAGWTSFDVVAKIRSQIRAQYRARGERPTKRQLRVGHTGTLDPFATGLLIILLGDACKRSDEFLKLDKVYEATITLGATSTTGDPEGEIVAYGKWKIEDSQSCQPSSNSYLPHAATLPEPSLDEVVKTLGDFTGEITQIPPSYSAIKIGGERAYKLARAGKTVDMPSRQVTIYSLDLIDYTYPELRIRAHVSSGTYIRTLAEDIGRALGTGAYCSDLRRTRVGDYCIDNVADISLVS